MKLYPNWRKIIRKAWSIKFLALAALLTGIEAVLPLFADVIPRGVFSLLTLIAVISAFVARLVAQKDIDDGDES